MSSILQSVNQKNKKSSKHDLIGAKMINYFRQVVLELLRDIMTQTLREHVTNLQKISKILCLL